MHDSVRGGWWEVAEVWGWGEVEEDWAGEVLVWPGNSSERQPAKVIFPFLPRKPTHKVV